MSFALFAARKLGIYFEPEKQEMASTGSLPQASAEKVMVKKNGPSAFGAVRLLIEHRLPSPFHRYGTHAGKQSLLFLGTGEQKKGFQTGRMETFTLTNYKPIL